MTIVEPPTLVSTTLKQLGLVAYYKHRLDTSYRRDRQSFRMKVNEQPGKVNPPNGVFSLEKKTSIYVAPPLRKGGVTWKHPRGEREEKTPSSPFPKGGGGIG
jgi:hypothetical protein